MVVVTTTASMVDPGRVQLSFRPETSTAAESTPPEHTQVLPEGTSKMVPGYVSTIV